MSHLFHAVDFARAIKVKGGEGRPDLIIERALDCNLC
jgi:hypothetical protein